MIKKCITMSYIIVIACFLGGCASDHIVLKLPENAVEYNYIVHSEWDTMCLEYNGKVYLPYSSGNINMYEDVIGYYFPSGTQDKNDPYREYVFSCKGLNKEEWILDYSGKENTKLTGHGVGMLFREESVLLIPESIEDESEYEWNLSMAR